MGRIWEGGLERLAQCADWCETRHERTDDERLCVKRITATHDMDGDPVTVTIERLSDLMGDGPTTLLVEMLAPLTAAAVYELTASLIDAGKVLQESSRAA